jgi:crotonobetainyl-CoA:carnitine CoA-transferase CaiB-like acyl-CoA transferase
MTSTLTGIRIVEMAGIGPVPFAGMMLADHGAEVIRVCRPGEKWHPTDVMLRSRKSIVLDMKNPAALEVAHRLPTPPINMVGDFGGGGMMLAFGMVGALLHVAVGAIEPRFFRELCRRLGVDDQDGDPQLDVSRWPALRAKLTGIFKSRSRAEWCALLENSDSCFAPVLSLEEAPGHPHNVERGTFIDIDGVVQPAPAPRFSKTPAAVPSSPVSPAFNTEAVLANLGYTFDEMALMKANGAIHVE